MNASKINFKVKTEKKIMKRGNKIKINKLLTKDKNDDKFTKNTLSQIIYFILFLIQFLKILDNYTFYVINI